MILSGADDGRRTGTLCARPRASFCCMPTACFACLILPTIKLLIATPPRKEKVCSSAARFVFSQRGACEGGWEGVHTNARCPLVLIQRFALEGRALSGRHDLRQSPEPPLREWSARLGPCPPLAPLVDSLVSCWDPCDPCLSLSVSVSSR